MGKRIHLAAQLSPGELARRYRDARDPVERSHYWIVWLLAQGKPTHEVAVATGYSVGWIRKLARRYNARGPAGLGDGRHHNPGGADRALLDARQREALGRRLQRPPPGGGLWTGRKVAAWIAAETGRAVSWRLGLEYLRRAGYTAEMSQSVALKNYRDGWRR